MSKLIGMPFQWNIHDLKNNKLLYTVYTNCHLIIVTFSLKDLLYCQLYDNLNKANLSNSKQSGNWTKQTWVTQSSLETGVHKSRFMLKVIPTGSLNMHNYQQKINSKNIFKHQYKEQLKSDLHNSAEKHNYFRPLN